MISEPERQRGDSSSLALGLGNYFTTSNPIGVRLPG